MSEQGASKKRRGMPPPVSQAAGAAPGQIASEEEMQRELEAHKARVEELEGQIKTMQEHVEKVNANLAGLAASSIPAGTDEELIKAAQELARRAAASLKADADAPRKRFRMPDLVDFSFKDWLNALKTDGGVGTRMLTAFVETVVAAASPADLTDAQRSERERCAALAIANVLQACNDK